MYLQPEKVPASEKASLLKRSVTGLVIVGVISLTVLSGAMPLLLLLLVLNYLALLEYQNLIQQLGGCPQKNASQMIGAFMILTTWFVLEQFWPASTFLLLIPVLFLLFFLELFRKKATPFQNIALAISGLIWISLPLSLFLCIGFLPLEPGKYHSFLVLGYFMILWLGDTGAYFVGRFAGKHPLFYRLSPKKTWEGSLGGLASALLGGFMNFYLFNELTIAQWLSLALIINLTGTFGDFTKSLLKRSVGVKDSGTILPGHGGILDRFDSLIGSAPFVFIYLWFFV